MEDGVIEFPDIDKKVKLPADGRANLIQKLQRLAQQVKLGFEFEEARGLGTVCFTAAGRHRLQYTVDGEPRPPVSQMEFLEDDMIAFPEINKKAKLPRDGRSDLIQQFQRLAQRVELGVEFEEASGQGTVCFTVAGVGCLQYTLSGEPQPPLSQMNFMEDGMIEFPDIDKKVKLPADGRADLIQKLQRLAHYVKLGVEFEEARGWGTLCFTAAGGGHLQYTLNGEPRPHFSQMTFEEDGIIDFPELNRKAKLPADGRANLTQQLQRLAQRVKLGIEFEDASGQGTVCFSVAGGGRLQYTLNGEPRPPFRQAIFDDDGIVRFPYIGMIVKIPIAGTDGDSELVQSMKDLLQLVDGSEETFKTRDLP